MSAKPVTIATSVIKNKTSIEMPNSFCSSFFQKPENFQQWQPKLMILPLTEENQ